MKYIIVPVLLSVALFGCNKSPSGSSASNISPECENYLAMTEDALAKVGQDNSQMKQMMEEGTKQMRDEWSKMTAEQQKEATAGCKEMTEQLTSMMKQLESMK